MEVKKITILKCFISPDYCFTEKQETPSVRFIITPAFHMNTDMKYLTCAKHCVFMVRARAKGQRSRNALLKLWKQSRQYISKTGHNKNTEHSGKYRRGKKQTHGASNPNNPTSYSEI